MSWKKNGTEWIDWSKYLNNNNFGVRSFIIRFFSKNLIIKDLTPKAPLRRGMKDLIINETNITELLKKKYALLGQGWITLLQVPIKNSLAVNVEAIRVLQSMGYEGIYITLSKDYLELSKILREAEIDLGKLAFIDGISQMYGVKQVEAPNVSYVAGPLSMDEISQRITEIAPAIKMPKKFVFLDSITTILLYNSLARTIRFSQFLNNTLKKLNLLGIVVSVSSGFANEALIKKLTNLSNEVINLQAKKSVPI